jgi:hypothetical protein
MLQLMAENSPFLQTFAQKASIIYRLTGLRRSGSQAVPCKRLDSEIT